MSCCCAPTCAIPSCPQPCCSQPCCSQPCCSQPCCSSCSYPVGGLGSLSCCNNACCNNTCCNNSCCNSCCGTSTSARCLGYTSGGNIGCINQIPPSEVCIQPPKCCVIIPGAVLAATCEPVRVGGYTACGGCAPCGRIC
ncbi:keratin-associated protein 5-4-like [Heteronotia binoei]|uniref:keratin-associated protein 5-4-like n=1 Tax=Heteronotia binoei TaxID=13085 RepID=UPI00292D829D|nr:keratin-associated protein 5-4-like [Heteronotia binoei]